MVVWNAWGASSAIRLWRVFRDSCLKIITPRRAHRLGALSSSEQSEGMSTLYLCYFGVREPLVQTQVLPYLRELAADGLRVCLLTFEPEVSRSWSSEQLKATRTQLAAQGIEWFCLPYHKRPSVPATLFDILAGARFAAQIMRREGIEVLHARAHMPMAMALLARRWINCKLIFDIRGLMAEEYVDAGVWGESSLPFRAVKLLERAGVRRADQVVVLTERMREWLARHKSKNASQIQVIPCCVDFTRFPVALAAGNGEGEGRFEVVYAGSVVGLYLLEEMGRFFLEVRRQRSDAFLRVLTASPPESATAVLRRAGLGADAFAIDFAPPSAVPAHLRRARLGISFRKPTFSQIAASPTKIPEYLAAGLPVVCNAGIGDTDELIERERIGVVLRSFDKETYAAAAEEALALAADPQLRVRCARVARQYFDLHEVGGQRYREVYRRLAETK